MSLDDWRLAWIARRNRMLASPAFQRFAARFPLTRSIARRRARALFDLVAGFTYSQTLYACVTSGLFKTLPADADTVATATGLPLDGAERLLRAAAALDLVERVAETWTLGQAGAALVGNGGIAEMVAHHDALYADLADPLALSQRGGGGGALSRYWTYAESPGNGGEAEVAPYSRLMAASQPMIAEQALGAYDFARHRRILDVGGGEGAFLAAIAPAAPRTALGLFDLPAVAERARARLGQDVTFHPGNFLSDPLPTGYDLITLIRILHDHDDGAALTLLRAIHAALPPGGRLLIVEPMAATPGAETVGTYFELYLLAMGSGRPRNPAELRRMLAEAGFSTSRLLTTHLPITARAIIATH